MQAYLKEHGKIIDFLHDASKYLSLSVLPRTTACILYHKACRKLQERNECIESYLLAATSVYLASKLEEQPQRIRDIVNVCYRLTHPKEEPLEIGKAYWNLRDSITTCELMVLRLFRFKVSFESPHKFLLHYIQLTEDIVTNRNEWHSSHFVQICWNLLNDATYIPIVAECKPDLMATVIFYVALKITMLEMPREENGKKWFKIFCPSVKEIELEKIGCKLLELYEARKCEEDTSP